MFSNKNPQLITYTASTIDFMNPWNRSALLQMTLINYKNDPNENNTLSLIANF